MASSSQPPLVWLRAFEAAGRTGSFKSAASELNVSPSTISHQIRDLEAHLGVPLFDRRGRTPELTAEGLTYLEPLQQGFDIIRNARPVSQQDTGALRIGAFPFPANEIVTPALNDLQQTVGQPIQVFTHTDIAQLSHVDPTERLDLIIRYAKPGAKFPGLIARKLSDVALLPIMGPNTKAPVNAADMLKGNLIRVIGPFEGWERWRGIFCPEADLPAFSIETDSFHSAALAVSRGEGFCLGVLPFVKPWIEQGRVNGLEEYALPIEDASVYAVYAPHNASNPAIAVLIDELLNLLT